jgi:TatA/E family protein of Tat protein translocase
MIGLFEILLVGAILMLVFGARHVSKAGSTLGKTLGGFRKGLKEDREKDVTPIPPEPPTTKKRGT